MDAAQQAYDVDVNRLNRAIAFTIDPRFQQLDEYQLQERIARFTEAFEGVDRNHRIIHNGTADAAAQQQLTAEFEAIEDRFTDALALYRRRVHGLAQAQVQGPAQAVGDPNNAAAAVNNPQVQAHAPPQGDGNNAAAAPLNAAPVPPAPGGNMPAGMNINVNLPFQPHQIQRTWGSFDGNPLNWFDFKQRFMLAVHDVDAVPRTNKLAYLRDALAGEAAEAMQGYGMDPNRYDEFWAALVAKYEQRYTLACAYLGRFFSLPRLQRSVGAADLRRMANDTNGLMRKLRELNYPVQHWDLILVHALQERLSDEYRRKWLTTRNGNDDPTILMMTTFLDDEATMLANRGLVYPPLQIAVNNPHAQQNYAAAPQQPPAGPSGQAYPCGVCGSMEHLPPTCPEFRPLTLNDRRKVAAANRMCFNCLKRGHNKGNCFDLRRCREQACQVDNAHNSMLCPIKNPAEYVQVVHQERHIDLPPAPADGSSSIPNFKRSVGRGRGSAWKYPQSEF